MIDHTGIRVSDSQRSKAFYAKALAPIGYRLLLEFPAAVTGSDAVGGFDEPPKADFWVAHGRPNSPPLHVAFRVKSRGLVDAFYQAALAAGGRDKVLRARARTITSITTAPRLRFRRSQHRSGVS